MSWVKRLYKSTTKPFSSHRQIRCIGVLSMIYCIWAEATTDPDSPLFGRVEGVVVVDVEAGSAAARTGLRKGDIIVSANRASIKSVSELNAALNNAKTLLLNLRRGNTALFLYLQ